MKYEIEISPEDLTDIVRSDLIESYHDPDLEDDDELNDAFIKVIDYYSNREQFQEFLNTIGKCNRGIEVPSGPHTFKTEGRYDL